MIAEESMDWDNTTRIPSEDWCGTSSCRITAFENDGLRGDISAEDYKEFLLSFDSGVKTDLMAFIIADLTSWEIRLSPQRFPYRGFFQFLCVLPREFRCSASCILQLAIQ